MISIPLLQPSKLIEITKKDIYLVVKIIFRMFFYKNSICVEMYRYSYRPRFVQGSYKIPITRTFFCLVSLYYSLSEFTPYTLVKFETLPKLIVLITNYFFGIRRGKACDSSVCEAIRPSKKQAFLFAIYFCLTIKHLY